MHVVYVCADPGVPVFGTKGASLHVQAVVRTLLRRGHEVSLVGARTGGAVPAGLEAVALFGLPEARGVDAVTREHAARRSAAAVADRVADAEAARGPAGLIYERYSLWSTGGMRAAVERSLPGVLEVNAPLIDEQARHRQLTDRRAAEQAARLAFRDATVVVAVSDAVAHWVRRRVPAPERVHVVPNGVDPDRFGPPAPPPAPFTVGFVGSLKPWHGVEVLIASLRHLPEGVELVVVGDGPERARLLQAAAPLAERVTFTGAVAPADVPALLSRMHVTVAPYPRDATYFSPLKLFEYLAAGTAVVASSVGQLPEIIEHERTGLLVPPDDPAALAAAIGRLRQDDRLRRSLGARARIAVRYRHSWDGVVDHILGLARAASPRTIRLPAETSELL